VRAGRIALARWLDARRRGVDERAPAEALNTQALVQRSGYHWVAATFGPLQGRRVLDAAAGAGEGSALLATAGARVVGIDVDRAVVVRAARAHPGVRFLVMDAARLAFAAGAFDLVVSQDTLEHVEDDRGAVREACRVLAPGGRFVVFTPRAPVHTARPANPFHRREYSAASLAALLGAHFAGVTFYGRRPGPRLRAAEAAMDRVRRWDALGLRRLLLPRALRQRLGDWTARRRGPGLAALSVADVEYFPGLGDTTTLIAVCTKAGAG